MKTTNKMYFHCSICGRTSTVEKKIKDCEASHVGVDTEKDLTLSYNRNIRTPYPGEIGVPMLDGSVAYYRFDHTETAK